MTDQLSIMLEWFASYSNFYSVLSVLICFCVMVVFILRLNGEHLGSTATHYNVIKEQKMVSLHNPFSVQLRGTRPSSVKDGLYLDISATRAASTCVVWGVDIQAFQRELSNSTLDIASNFREMKLFGNNYLHLTDLSRLNSVGKLLEMNAQCPDGVTEAALGEPPRRMYPVVSVSLLDEDSTLQDSTNIVVQFTVFHLKDALCRLDSHIVYQFIKTNHNKVLSLQPIFLVSSDPATTDPKPGPHPSSPGTLLPQPGHDVTSSTASTGAKDTPQRTCDKCKQIRNSGKESLDDSNDDALTCDCETKESYSEESLEIHGSREPSSTDVQSDMPNNFCDIGLDESNLCIVCQSAVIFYTLLPCRHACVCDTCIKLLDRCPMCRGYIDAYFRLHDSQCGTVGPEHSETEDSGPTLSWWQAFNRRINEFLGFS